MAGVAPGGQVHRGGQRMPKVYLERGGIPELMWSTHNSWAILMIKHDQPPYFSFFFGTVSDKSMRIKRFLCSLPLPSISQALGAKHHETANPDQPAKLRPKKGFT